MIPAVNPRLQASRQYVWNTSTLAWDAMTQPGGGGGGGDASEATLATRLADATFTGRVGDVSATPTANTVLGRLKSVEDKLDTLNTELAQKTEPANTQAVSAASLPLPTGAATETTLGTRLTEADFDTKVGGLTEAAPGSDTASSGLNGRLQRIAQRLTSLIALLPAALVGGRLDVNLGAAPAAISTKTALTASAPTSGSVGTSSASLVASNANRRGLVLTNRSNNEVSLGVGATAVAGSGIVLAPGAVWTMNEYTFTTAQINAIASAAASNVGVQEFTT